jgi:transcriptional regulator with XRE-family HTH domain
MAPGDGESRIGGHVRAARRSRGMSLEVLAGLTGRSKGWLSKIENGHARLERRQDIAAIRTPDAAGDAPNSWRPGQPLAA